VAISISQITTGKSILVGADIFLVVEHQHVKPGKGGAFARTKLKNIKTDQVIEKTFKPVDKVEEIILDERKLENLYQSGDSYHFMDHDTFEEVAISKDVLKDAVRFLTDHLEVIGFFYNDEILKVILPTFVSCEITHTEPGFKGDSSRAGNKPATIETGAAIGVPLFINIGDRIKVDTRSGEYVERVKK